MADNQQKIIVEIKDEGGKSEKTLKSLRKQISDLKDSLLNLEEGTDLYEKTKESLRETQEEINRVNRIVKESTAAEDQNTKTLSSLRKEINSYKNDLLNLNEGTEEYLQTLNKLNSAQEEINTLNNAIKESTRSLEVATINVEQSVQALAGGFTAAQGAVALFNSNSEDLQKTMAKLQGSVAMAQGLAQFAKGIQGANISFKALNATIAANPIGALLTVIIALVAALASVKDEFSFITEPVQELWNSVKDLLPSLDNLKEIINGVGTAIVRFYSGPLKALIKVIQGDFVGAVEEAKRGFDILGNFDDGYTTKAIDNAKNRLDAFNESVRQIAATSAKNIKNQIDENEAKLGSDWKYTKEGKKLYETYYNILSTSYKKDSDEYLNSLNQKYSFTRDYNNRINAAAKEIQSKNEEEERQRRENELRAENDYSETIVQIEKDKQKRITDAYKGYDRINFLFNEIEENEKLQSNLLKIVKDENLTWQERAQAAKDYRQALSDNYELTVEYNTLLTDFDAQNDLRIQREIELQGLLNEAKNPENLSDEEQLEKLKLEAETYWNAANDISKSYDERIEALNKYKKAKQEIAVLEKKQAEDEKNLRRATLEATKDFLSESSKLVGENTAAGKTMAVASAVINTYLGATMALASYPPPASYIAMGATIVAGMATVAQILKTKVPGSADSSAASAASAQIPDMPGMDPNFIETHNNMSSYEEETFSTTQTVLVVEDLNEAQTRVNVAEKKATF